MPVRDGGTLATLEGGPFVEEYPTTPASYVLNGALFAVWGYHDVGLALRDSDTSERFDELIAVLERALHHYDAGYWSRYDLYPHLIPNVASPAYHLLHIKQLQVMGRLTEIAAFSRMAERFEGYRASALVPPARLRREGHLQGRDPAQRQARPPPALGGPEVGVPTARRGTARTAPIAPWSSATTRSARTGTRRFRSPRRPSPSSSAYLVRRGYTGATFSDIAHGRRTGKVVAVTFDDAYRSVHRLARPILEKFGLPATLFVPTRYIGQEEPMAWPGIDEWLGGPHEAELMPMSWEEARELHDAGWEIGSHTVTHPELTTVSDEQLEDELSGSRAACEEQIGAPCESIAFPYGDHDDRVVTATARAGYLTAATLPSKMPGSEQPLRWPRVGIYYADDMRVFRLKVSPTMRRLRRTGVLEAAVAPVRRVRSALRS